MRQSIEKGEKVRILNPPKSEKIGENAAAYSVDSIKRTVLLKVLLLKKTSKNLY